MTKTTYFNGDQAEYTGVVLQIHGGTFYEVVMLEGIYKGQTKAVKNPPTSLRPIDRTTWTPKHYTTKETAQLIRAALKTAFPGVKFSVRTSYASMTSSTDVRWTDGPTTPEVERVTDAFTSRGFDGMTDSTTFHDQDFGGERVSFSGWVHVTRETSPELKARAYARVCREHNVEPRADGQFWNDYRPTGYNATIGEETGRTLYRMRPSGCLVTLKAVR
jgi:hypothetical protein